MLTDTQRLARTLDALLAKLPREEWPTLIDDARIVAANQWSATVDGRPACPDCQRYQAYASHRCGCPNRKVVQKMGPLLAAEVVK